MKKTMIILCIMALFPMAAFAQNLKVENLIPIEDADEIIDFPVDLNGAKCALLEIKLSNESVAFEGNVVGTPSYRNGVYYVFLSPNSKYLNIKYPSEKPLLVRFSDYDIRSLPAMSMFRVEMYEPSANLSEQFNNNIADISPEAENMYEKGGWYMAQNDYTNAYDCFIKAYELGHPKAAYSLGVIYSDPFYEVRNNKYAKEMGNLIPVLPVERDLVKAFTYYKVSAEAGYVGAQYALGEYYEKGLGVDKNKDEAMAWYEKAAEQGHLPALDKLGKNIKKNIINETVISYGSSSNEFIPNDIECDVNDLTAITNGRKDKNDQYCALLKVLLPFDNVNFMGNIIGEPLFKTNEYWVYMPQGAKEIEINYPDFKPLKIKFKEMGIDKLIGKNTYTVSISFPIDLLKDGADLTADDLYKIGYGYMERKDNQYIRWMEKAADKGHPKAMSVAGSNYLYGTDGNKDVAKGISYLERASDGGIGEASYLLGFYYLGKDKKKARIWFDKAESQGYNSALGKNPFNND